MMKIFMLFWKRIKEYRQQIIILTFLEVFFSVVTTLLVIFIWTPILSNIFQKKYINVFLLFCLFLLINYVINVLTQYLKSARIKLALKLTQKIKREFSAYGLQLSYTAFKEGELQGKLKQVDDILNYEFDYSDMIEFIVELLKDSITLLLSFTMVIYFLWLPSQTTVFGLSLEKNNIFNFVLCIVLLFFFSISLFISYKHKKQIRNKIEQSFDEHIEIEKKFAYYRNEVVFRFDIYSLIQVFQFQPLLSKKMYQNSEANKRYFLNFRMLRLRSQMVSYFLVVLNSIIMLLLVIYKLATKAIQATLFITVFESMQLFFTTLFKIFDDFQNFKMKLPYLNLFEDVLTNQNTVAVNKKAISNSTASGWRFENVSYRYPNAQEYALKDVSFVLEERGTHILVGSNGSGKSTLLLLLCGLLKPTSGKIFFRDELLENWDLEVYHNLIGVNFQDVNLFPTTLQENINIFAMSNQKIINLLEWDVEDSLLQRWQATHNILECGLSGGEKEKIILAALFSSDKQNLMLDEPSAALDAKSEAYLYEKMKKLEKMIFLVSHRLSVCKECEDIFVLEKGKLIARGNHEQLLKTTTYRNLWDAQTSLYHNRF